MPQPLQLSGSLLVLVQCLLQQAAPGAEPQSALLTQSSQVCVFVSQLPRPASVLGQSLSALQPGTQVSPSQYEPFGQSSGAVEQATPDRSAKPPPSGPGTSVRSKQICEPAARSASVQPTPRSCRPSA